MICGACMEIAQSAATRWKQFGLPRKSTRQHLSEASTKQGESGERWIISSAMSAVKSNAWTIALMERGGE